MKEAAPNTTMMPPRRMLLYLPALREHSTQHARGGAQRVEVRPEHAVEYEINAVRALAKLLHSLLQLDAKLQRQRLRWSRAKRWRHTHLRGIVTANYDICTGQGVESDQYKGRLSN
jgi:hypothetical protein